MVLRRQKAQPHRRTRRAVSDDAEEDTKEDRTEQEPRESEDERPEMKSSCSSSSGNGSSVGMRRLARLGEVASDGRKEPSEKAQKEANASAAVRKSSKGGRDQAT